VLAQLLARPLEAGPGQGAQGCIGGAQAYPQGIVDGGGQLAGLDGEGVQQDPGGGVAAPEQQLEQGLARRVRVHRRRVQGRAGIVVDGGEPRPVRARVGAQQPGAPALQIDDQLPALARPGRRAGPMRSGAQGEVADLAGGMEEEPLAMVIVQLIEGLTGGIEALELGDARLDDPLARQVDGDGEVGAAGPQKQGCQGDPVLERPAEQDG
jgi:hypothetical protein